MHATPSVTGLQTMVPKRRDRNRETEKDKRSEGSGKKTWKIGGRK